MTLYEELLFAAQTLSDARRTIHCEPHRLDEIRALVDQMGVSALLTVRGNPACPAGKLLVVDEQAMRAATNQTFQRAAKNIRRP